MNKAGGPVCAASGGAGGRACVHVGVHGEPVPGGPDPNEMRWGTALRLTGRKLRLTTCRGRDIYR